MSIFNISNGQSATGNSEADSFFVFGDLTAPATLDGGFGDPDTLDAVGPATIGPAVLAIGIENLALDGDLVSMSAFQLNRFFTIVPSGGATFGRLALTQGGGATVDVAGLAELDVTGSGEAESLDFEFQTTTTTNIFVHAGDGDDAVTASEGNDNLLGGKGDDTLNGGGGVDFLDGGAGADTLNGGDGGDTLRVRGGDTANGGAGDDVFGITTDVTAALLDGGGGTDTFHAQGSAAPGAGVEFLQVENLAVDADVLTLTARQLDSFLTIVSDDGATVGRVALTTGAADSDVDIDVAGLASLEVTGSGQADDLDFEFEATSTTAITVDAGSGDDAVASSEGRDTLRGGIGADRLLGRGGNDALSGGTGNDGLEGGAGKDRLDGGAGNDGLRGGGAADTFAFAAGGGADNVLDFADGVDRLSFAGFGPRFDSVGEIVGAADQVGANTVITLDNPGAGTGATVVTLVGFELADLSAADFGPVIA